MPFITRCQYCRHRALVPDGALGVSLECPSCRAWYTVVPAEDPGPAPKPTPLPLNGDCAVKTTDTRTKTVKSSFGK